MEITAYPKKVGEATYNGETYPMVQIICPVCESKKVEPLPSLYNDKWLCCRCETVFTVKEKSNE